MSTYIDMKNISKEIRRNSKDTLEENTFIHVHEENICANSQDNINESPTYLRFHKNIANAETRTHEKGTCMCSGVQGTSSRPSSEFLEKLFRNKCLFAISESKVCYVRDIVETFVTSVIRKVLNSDLYIENVETNISNMSDEFVNSVQITTAVSDQSLVKVGSFYETSKNYLPDEFDFIFVLAEYDAIDGNLNESFASSFIKIFYTWIDRHADTDIRDCLPKDGSLVLGRYFVRSGPATKIGVTLKNNDPDLNEMTVSIDLTPAVRIRLNDTLPCRLKVCYPDWKDYIFEIGCVFIVETRKFTCNSYPHSSVGKYLETTAVTITESELFAMKTKLSEKHKKVYRLLKYMFNGNETGFETAIKQAISYMGNPENFCARCLGYPNSGVFMYGISSYSLKLLMFHHMQHCENTGTESLKPCIIDVLEYIIVAVRNTELSRVCRCVGAFAIEEYQVKVQSMTEQTVNILDDYGSAMAVADVIENLAECVKKTEDEEVSEEHDIMKHIPVISKGSDIVQSSLMRIKRKGRIYNFFLIALIGMPTISIGLFLAYNEDPRILYCWNGISAIEGLRHKEYALSADLHERTTMENDGLIVDLEAQHKHNASAFEEQVFCLALQSLNSTRTADEGVNMSGLYACRMDPKCNGKLKFHDEVGNISDSWPVWCDTYAFETNGSLPSLMGSSRALGSAVCHHSESCLNISRLTYRAGRVTGTRVYSNCSEETGCPRQILTDVHISSCFLSQTERQKSNQFRKETEICCCETDPCEKPQQDPVRACIIRALYALLFFFLFCIVMLVVGPIYPGIYYVIFDARTGIEHHR